MGIRDAARQSKPKEQVKVRLNVCGNCTEKKWIESYADQEGQPILLSCPYFKAARLRTAKSCEHFKQE